MSDSNPWAAIVGRGRDGARALVQRLVRELRAAGLRVGGGKQAHTCENIDGDEVDRGCDLIDLDTGACLPLARVSATPELCDYVFDADAFARGVEWMARDYDVVFLEVGKLEAAKRGHWPAVEAALQASARVVVLTLRPDVLASVVLDMEEPLAGLEAPFEEADVVEFLETLLRHARA